MRSSTAPRPARQGAFWVRARRRIAVVGLLTLAASAGLVSPVRADDLIDVESITWFSPDGEQEPLRLPHKGQLHFTFTRDIWNTETYVRVIDLEFPEYPSYCSHSTACWINGISRPWSENGDPGPKTFRIEVVDFSSDSDVVIETHSVEVPFETRYFDVGITSYGSEPAGDRVKYSMVASATPAAPSTPPYALILRRADGSVFRQCDGYAASCGFFLYAGETACASYEDGQGRSFGRSSCHEATMDGVTALTQDGVDLVALARSLPSMAAVCDVLTTFPGTHTVLPASSLSDQLRACLNAEAAGLGVRAGLLAVAAVAPSAVLHYLVTRADVAEEAVDPLHEPPPGYDRPVPPTPPVITEWDDDIEDQIEAFRDRNPSITLDVATTVFKRCRVLVARASLSSERCRDLPVFVPGELDNPSTTQHRRAAIARVPGWVSLAYAPIEERAPDGWYANYLPCSLPTPVDQDCDEYPFKSTHQGGRVTPFPSLRYLSRTQNRSEGRKLSLFYQRCGLDVPLSGTDARPFLVVPAPKGSDLPTLRLCNGHSPVSP